MPVGSSLLLVLLMTPSSLCVPETAASGSRSNAVVAAVKLSVAGAMPSLQGHLSPVAGSSRQGHSALSAQMVAVPGPDAGEAGICRLLPQLAGCECTTQLFTTRSCFADCTAGHKYPVFPLLRSQLQLSVTEAAACRVHLDRCLRSSTTMLK